MECLDPFFGLNVQIYDTFEEAKEIFEHEKEMHRYSEIYRAVLIRKGSKNE